VSLNEQVDTSTPMGKMVFTVLGAVAELERSLIVERVRAGLRNACAIGKCLGRPRKILDTKRIAALRAQGVGSKRIAAELGVGVGAIHQAAHNAASLSGGSKTEEKAFLNPSLRHSRRGL
jgi:DNA invertase Pin-like site-specific DNA recombinase